MPERSKVDQEAAAERERREARRMLGFLTFGPGLMEAPVGVAAPRAEGRLVALPGMPGAPVAAPPGLPVGGPPQAEDGDGDGKGEAGGRGGGSAES